MRISTQNVRRGRKYLVIPFTFFLFFFFKGSIEVSMQQVGKVSLEMKTIKSLAGEKCRFYVMFMYRTVL